MYKLDLCSANISISLVAYDLDFCNANMSISLLVYKLDLCNANTSISLVVYELDDWRLVGRTRRSIRALPRAPSGLDQIFWNKLLYLFLFVFLCFLLQYSSHEAYSDIITKKCLSFYSQIPQIKLIPMSFLYLLFVLGKCISFLNRVQCAMWFFSSEAIILLILYFSHFFCKSRWTPKMEINNEMFKSFCC